MMDKETLKKWCDATFQIGERGAMDFLRVPPEKRLPPVEVIERVVTMNMRAIRNDSPALASDPRFLEIEKQLIRYMRLGWWGVILQMRRKLQRGNGA